MHDGIRSALTRAVLGFMFLSCVAHAGGQPVKFNLPSQSLAQSLRALASQTQTNILFDQALVRGLTARALDAELSLDQAMDLLLAGTGLTYRKTDEKTVVIAPARGAVVPPASRDTSTATSASRVAALGSSTDRKSVV